MRLRALFAAVVLGAAIAGCQADTDITNPNQPDSQTFWKTQSDALQGINATYNALLRLGTFLRWQGFTYDIRSDIGYSPSPWTDLANFNKFTFATYDFDVNHDTWNDSYTLVFRANQVIANVPSIDMDATLRDRIVGEAKFLRALTYFHLMTLYGAHIPLITAPPLPGDRPASSDSATVWAQIEQDLTDAKGALPASYDGADLGRATSGAAQALLGKVLLQERKWSAAATELQAVIQSGRYSLAADYGSNFTPAGRNNSESLFEVQVGDPTLAGSQGVPGLNIAKMIGACGPGYCDGRPTPWFFAQFFKDSTVDGKVDPRLDATLFWNKPGGEDVYGVPFASRYADALANHRPDTLYFKKYGEYWIPGDQSWDANIDYKVLRYADVLLMYAEALNEQGQTDEAYPYVNQVRQRVNLKPLPTGLDQTGMRDAILHERLLEFGLEGQRWLDLGRQNLFADLDALKAHDPEFQFFTPNKSELLPIPTAEINLNPSIVQNPGW
ncbi:MAG TPA: RagB/SusD family nutrient uptake outer membrane protein [Gemmatimonadaceae bacterium]